MARRSHAVALFRRQYRSPETDGKKETAAPNTHHSLIDWMITMIMIMMKAAELLWPAGQAAPGAKPKEKKAKPAGPGAGGPAGGLHTGVRTYLESTVVPLLMTGLQASRTAQH